MDSKNQIVLSHHTIGATLVRIFTAELTELEAIFLVLFLSIAVLYGVSWIIMKQRGVLSNQIQLQTQKLPDFFQALKKDDLQEMIEEELAYNELGVKTFDLK